MRLTRTQLTRIIKEEIEIQRSEVLTEGVFDFVKELIEKGGEKIATAIETFQNKLDDATSSIIDQEYPLTAIAKKFGGVNLSESYGRRHKQNYGKYHVGLVESRNRRVLLQEMELMTTMALVGVILLIDKFRSGKGKSSPSSGGFLKKIGAIASGAMEIAAALKTGKFMGALTAVKMLVAAKEEVNNPQLPQYVEAGTYMETLHQSQQQGLLPQNADQQIPVPNSLTPQQIIQWVTDWQRGGWKFYAEGVASKETEVKKIKEELDRVKADAEKKSEALMNLISVTNKQLDEAQQKLQKAEGELAKSKSTGEPEEPPKVRYRVL